MSASRLAHVLVDRLVARLARKGKLFEDGFGDVAKLRGISGEIRDYTLAREVGVEKLAWERPEKTTLGVRVRRGTFESPLARLLPPEARTAHFELLLPPRPRGVCLLLAATAEEGFARRRLFARHLLAEGLGVASLESPLYGLRRPAGQVGPRIRTVAEHFALNLATVDEGRALLAYLRAEVCEDVGVSGFSQGGFMGGFVAALSPFPLAAILRGAGDSVLPVFTRDALTRVVSLLRPDWQPERIRGALLDDKRPPRDVVRAAVDAALDPDVRHPGAIAHRTAGSATPTPPNLRRDDLCPIHLDDAATCRGCAADRKARREETT